MTEFWPFLISANQVLDFNTVTAPPFVLDAKASIMLAGATGGTLTKSGEARYCEMLGHPQMGDVSLVYQIVPAMDGDKKITDPIGRPIRRIEGIVIKGRHPDIAISQSILDQAHALVDKDFQEFSKSTSQYAKYFPSNAVVMPATATDTPLTLTRMKPYNAVPLAQRTARATQAASETEQAGQKLEETLAHAKGNRNAWLVAGGIALVGATVALGAVLMNQKKKTHAETVNERRQPTASPSR